MARKYDIIERLKSKNERPVITIDEEHEYTINTEKTNVMSLMALVDDAENKSSKDQLKLNNKIIEIALGKKALEYISSLNLSISAESYIIEAIMAGISDMDIEDLGKVQKK